MAWTCVFGDSITWGWWDTELGGWVNRLRITADKLIDLATCGRWVSNCGIAGDRAVDVLGRITAEARAHQDESLILAIGINDASHDVASARRFRAPSRTEWPSEVT